MSSCVADKGVNRLRKRKRRCCRVRRKSVGFSKSDARAKD